MSTFPCDPKSVRNSEEQEEEEGTHHTGGTETK